MGSHLQHLAHSDTTRLTGHSPETILTTYISDAHPSCPATASRRQLHRDASCRQLHRDASRRQLHRDASRRQLHRDASRSRPSGSRNG